MSLVAALFRRLHRTTGSIPRSRIPHGSAGIKLVGHREAVGGMWDEVGALQFQYLKNQGLQPHHVLLDIACGCLRGGVHFIPYLDVGNYLGIEKEQEHVNAGVSVELGQEMFEAKRPELVVTDAFEFHCFTRKPNLAIAQSLFTHLTPDHIHLCLANLRDFVEPGHRAYVTFFEGDSSANSRQSHDHRAFRYSADEMAAFGAAHRFDPVYIGDWNHPRHQKMMRYIAV